MSGGNDSQDRIACTGVEDLCVCFDDFLTLSTTQKKEELTSYISHAPSKHHLIVLQLYLYGGGSFSNSL